ncbi:MAG TPA: hypothetical protein VFW94_15130 [Candidatus Acidoferrales bacterium]|nr:hypothetical protein [Candidatus Acidoferrales bacterium]
MSTFRIQKLSVQGTCSSFLWMAKEENLHPSDQILVGRRVSALHRARGWNAEVFAKSLLKESPPKFNNWTRGRHLIPPQVAAKVATLTGSDFNFIYGGNSAGMDPKFVVKVTEELDQIEAKEATKKPAKRKARRA